MKSILFISHDASRTGAPIVLLHFIRWFKQQHPNVVIGVLLLRGGELEPEFSELASQTFNAQHISKPPKLLNRIVRKLKSKLGFSIKSRKNTFLEQIAQYHYDVIYANTIISIPFAAQLKSLMPQCKLLCHIHELKTVIDTELPNIEDYADVMDGCIAASHLVKSHLVNHFDIEPNLIDVVYEFSVVNPKITQTSKPKNSFIVGASGSLNWRKGNDIFIQIAQLITKNHPDANIEFVWVGGQKNSNVMKIIRADLEKANLKDKVQFVGSTETPEAYYKTFDVFIMPSREDPFPLVCIEAAMLMKPIICFEGATGTAELLQQGGGYIVPYLDIEAMCDKILFYFNNNDALKRDGQKAQSLFESLTPEKMAPLIDKYITTLLTQGD
ncbi:glycosyltransferase family 4 protein [Aestuariivivens marinum]|uniref:glycosyltransferase family 4 protein n=1 Tax=Aestuariivivens marinum TaxID=2913555 RepID=UPI001F59EFC0|nr:glycosyltransferase family 4 protein [Aestuariivivens marinum]